MKDAEYVDLIRRMAELGCILNDTTLNSIVFSKKDNCEIIRFKSWSEVKNFIQERR